MDWLRRKRIKQIIIYGWKDSAVIANNSGKGRLMVFLDIISCFRKYFVFSNQYKKNELWKLNQTEYESLASKLGNINLMHDKWVIENYENHKFLEKWTQKKWETTSKGSLARKNAYTKFFKTGKDLHIQYNVEIRREHFLFGSISIGNDVLLAKNVFIDYSGELIIHDNVSLADGVIIETHTHPLEKSRQVPVPSRLEIGEGVKVLSRSYIADTCHSIGRYARIGAGTYVRSNIPPYAIVMGNPAKIIGFLYSPEEMVEFERDKYPESERTSLEQYTLWYEKYFRSRSKEIKSFIKL
jgi:acetyltransferase-like isoleucine patch superfamily enzyme